MPTGQGWTLCAQNGSNSWPVSGRADGGVQNEEGRHEDETSGSKDGERSFEMGGQRDDVAMCSVTDMFKVLR